MVCKEILQTGFLILTSFFSAAAAVTFIVIAVLNFGKFKSPPFILKRFG